MTTPSSTPLDTEAIEKLIADARKETGCRCSTEPEITCGAHGDWVARMLGDLSDALENAAAEVKWQAGLLARIRELPRFHMKTINRGYSVEEFSRPLIEAKALDAILNDESEAGK